MYAGAASYTLRAMRKLSLVVQTSAIVLALIGCKGKKEEAATGSGAKTADTKPMSCPPGNVIKDGACTQAITAEKLAVVEQQKSRIDELAALLEKVDTVATPIELVNSFRQTPEWQGLVAKVPKLASVEQTVATLDGAVKQLRVFKGQLGEASARIGNLKGELDRLMTDTGATRQLADVQARVSSELRGTFEPLGAQVSDTIEKAIAPLATQFEGLSDMVVGTCLVAKSQAGDKLKSLCSDAKTMFERANTFIGDVKQRPAQVFEDVSGKLESELELLVDAQTKKALDEAQQRVNAAMRLSATPGAAGSATGSAAGSAAPAP